MKIIIDRTKCIGSGNCVFNAGGVFEQDDEGLAIVVDPTAKSEHEIEFAASTCPVRAITIKAD